MEEPIPEKRKKIVFEGVSPELLRATTPFPLSTQGKESVSDDLEETPAPEGEVPPGETYGLRQGKEACLRSVLQRLRSGNMTAIEEARAMNFLIENQVVENQAELSTAMDKPKSKISEKLSLLKLPRSVQLLMERHPEAVSSGHAIELLRLKDSSLITSVAGRILEQKLSRDRLRTEISFLLDKHGVRDPLRTKRPNPLSIRYFPKVDGGFDLIYRFRPEGEQTDLEKMISHMETKVKYLKQVLSTREIDQEQKGSKKGQAKTTVLPGKALSPTAGP